MSRELLSNFTFRKATSDEVPEIVTHYNDVRASINPCMHESTDWAPFNSERIQHIIQAQNLYLLCRRDTNTFIGATFLSLEAPHFWRDLTTPAIYVEKFSVTASLRKGGLQVGNQRIRVGGQIFLPLIEEYARTLGLHYLRLDYPTENKKLGEYYLKIGFKVIDQATYTGPISGNLIRATLLQRSIQ